MNETISVLKELKSEIASRTIETFDAGQAKTIEIIQKVLLDSIEAVIKNHGEE